MGLSTWWDITHGMSEALDKSYMSKSKRQRRKKEVADVWNNGEDFCLEKQRELASGAYAIGEYRHFKLNDKKKSRDISVLPFADRCVQNSIKNAIEPLLMRMMTDDMMGGLPGRGILVQSSRRGVILRMRRILSDRTLTHYIQGDIRKFYDNVDNVTAMRLIERVVTDKRTRALIRQHLFKQKKLAIGDPMSHLIANLVMSVIIRLLKAKIKGIEVVNFADDVFIAGKGKEVLAEVRKEMQRLAKASRLHYKRIYIRPIDDRHDITFCGYKFGRDTVRLVQRTKKRYVRSRHSRRSVGSYKGILELADTKHLRYLVENKDNRHMADKIRRPFAGRPMKIETLEGITHHIVDFTEKVSRQRDCESYMHIQAIADALGLIVYSTGSTKICEYLNTKTANDLPLRNMKIVHDWSGYYYEGTVYTDAEEEAMIRDKFNIK